MNRLASGACLALAALVTTTPVCAQGWVKGATRVNADQPQPAPPPPAIERAPDTNPVQAPQSRVVTPASLEQQVRQLQDEVAALQTIVEQLQARLPPPGEYIVTDRGPARGMVCGHYGLENANEILARAYNLNDISRREYPAGMLVPMWGSCRQR
jgi:hypothetical protein